MIRCARISIKYSHRGRLIGERSGIGRASNLCKIRTAKANYCTTRSFSNKSAGHNTSTTTNSGNKTSSKDEGSSFFSAFPKWYSDKLDSYPKTTKFISSGIIAGFGDLICQSMTQPAVNLSSSSSSSSSEQDPKEVPLIHLDWDNWDSARTGRFATLGAAFFGTVIHYWYGWLSRAFPHSTVIRVAIDQSCFAPVSVTAFLSLLWLWEGDTPYENMPTRLKENVPSIVVANWSLWIPAQVVNFGFVRPKYQVLFSNFVALAWNAYLSYASRNETQEPPAAAQDDNENKKS